MQKVGLILKKAREQEGLRIQEVAEKTRIQPKFIVALENGDYSVFAGPVYIKGFLKNYAHFLGLDSGKVLAFWRREYEEEGKERTVKKFIDPFLLPKFSLTPAVVIGVVVFILVSAFFGYIFWQYRSFAKAPPLEIQNPTDGLVADNFRINAVGNTEPGTDVFLNGERVQVSDEGVFATSVELAEGINVLEFMAQNKLGRETKESRTVIVLPPEEVADEPVVAGEASVSATPSGEATPSAQGS